MLAVVVDLGLGNLRSVEKALEAAAADRGLEVRVERSTEPERVRQADRVVVPGQGSFGAGARALGGGLGEAVLESMQRGIPFLGICLGLQLLFESSDEAPGLAGLAWFRGRVVQLARTPGLKIPHMGWNQLELRSEGHPHLQAAGGSGAWLYFVHSFYALPADPSIVRATVSYGQNVITAAVARDNVFATQFHPEKSQRAGLALLGSFLSS